jgi:tRNA (mo5U34)-methyltransferase
VSTTEPAAGGDIEHAVARVAAVNHWWHSIEVAPGVVTPGRKTPEIHASELASFRLPDLTGKSVLDIGGWDGFYAFHAEECGARRVGLLDSYVWSLDIAGLSEYLARCAEQGVTPKAYHETEFWHPDELPGKRGFDTARELRRSTVEPIVADFAKDALAGIGTWDVVLFLGVLYHLEDPLGGLRRLAALTNECAVLETEAIVIGGRPDASLWEFYPTNELGADPSNWFVPTPAALEGALLAAGFSRAELLVEPPPANPATAEVVHYRAVAHAFK